MNSKSITRIVLLGIVGLAIGGWAMKELGSEKPVSQATEATEGFTRPDGVTVINFHSDKRCRTCINIGNLARETVDEHFAGAMESGVMHWENINYATPENAHLVTEYELVSSIILITRWEDGKEKAWQRLDAVWDHRNDEPTFKSYVAREIETLMNLP